MQAGQQPSPTNAHPWLVPFKQFTTYADETVALVNLSINGLRRIIAWPDFLKAAFHLDDSDDSVAEANRQAELARPEVERDFPLLHAHALLGLWSGLEALVEDSAVAWLLAKPDILQRPEFSKIRIPIGEYRLLAPESQMSYIINEVQRDIRLMPGITRFERLLNLIGLGGAVSDEELRKAIYEAQQVRNALAHRGGLADRKLLEACPWLGLKHGQPLHVTHERFLYYRNAIYIYTGDVLNRFRIHEGMEPIVHNRPPLNTMVEEVETSSTSPE
jgi:hypothetical protein